jgi:hypothetical protein
MMIVEEILDSNCQCSPVIPKFILGTQVKAKHFIYPQWLDEVSPISSGGAIRKI